MRLFERPDGCAKMGLRMRRFVRLRTGPGCVRGPLRGRTGGWPSGGNTKEKRGGGASSANGVLCRYICWHLHWGHDWKKAAKR